MCSLLYGQKFRVKSYFAKMCRLALARLLGVSGDLRREQSQDCHLVLTEASCVRTPYLSTVGLASGMENRKLSSEDA